MKIEIELSEEEVKQFSHRNHPDGYKDQPDSGISCCHCELCGPCREVLWQVQVAVIKEQEKEQEKKNV